MSTEAARLHGERSEFQAMLEDLIFKSAERLAGLLGLGALLYLAFNWGLAAGFTFLKPLSGFWMGPMVVGGLYFTAIVVKHIWKDDVSLSLDDIGVLVAKLAPIAVLVAAYWATHHYLV